MDDKEELTLFDVEEPGKQNPLIDIPTAEQEPGEPLDPKYEALIKTLLDTNEQIAEMTRSLTELQKTFAKPFEQFKQLTNAIQEPPFLKAFQNIALAVAALSDELIALGVESAKLTDAANLFDKDIIELVFTDVLNLARELKQKEQYKDLKLKDLAQAIKNDLSVDPASPYYDILNKCLVNARKAARAEKIKQAKKSREKAVSVGAIMSVNRHLAAPSEKELAQLFTPNNVFLLKSTELFDKEGRLQEQEGKQAEIERTDTVHTQFLMLVFQMVCLSYDPTTLEQPEDKITFNIPAILKELGIDERGSNSKTRKSNSRTQEQRLKRIIELVEPSRDKLIRLPRQEQYYKLCDIDSIDKEAETITLNVPYFYRLVEYIAQQKYKDRAINKLFHSTVANETNSAAVELAARILAGVKQRGLHKDNLNLGIGATARKVTKKTKNSKGETITQTTIINTVQPLTADIVEEQRITYSTRWESLILDCPQLTAKLNAVMASNKTNKAALFNNILADTFNAAFRIIMEKSDAPQYYLDFRIEPVDSWGKPIAPTKSKLKQIMKVSHKGKNKQYISPK